MATKKSEYISFRATKEIKELLDEEAQRTERPISWIVNKIIEQYFSDQQKKNQTVNFNIQHNENINL